MTFCQTHTKVDSQERSNFIIVGRIRWQISTKVIKPPWSKMSWKSQQRHKETHIYAKHIYVYKNDKILNQIMPKTQRKRGGSSLDFITWCRTCINFFFQNFLQVELTIHYANNNFCSHGLVKSVVHYVSPQKLKVRILLGSHTMPNLYLQ